MIIAGTNVVSELMKQAPDAAVLAWARRQPVAALSICVVTVEEIERGLSRLPQGKRRRDLTQRSNGLVDAFADTIAIYDVTAARTTGANSGRRRAAGRPFSLADAQIAGICLAGGHDLTSPSTRSPPPRCRWVAGSRWHPMSRVSVR